MIEIIFAKYGKLSFKLRMKFHPFFMASTKVNEIQPIFDKSFYKI
jgi:hypothetical protein